MDMLDSVLTGECARSSIFSPPTRGGGGEREGDSGAESTGRLYGLRLREYRRGGGLGERGKRCLSTLVGERETEGERRGGDLRRRSGGDLEGE